MSEKKEKGIGGFCGFHSYERGYHKTSGFSKLDGFKCHFCKNYAK